MYNLTVDTANTYFVGEGQWLVHNCEWLGERLGLGSAPAWGKEMARQTDQVYLALPKNVRDHSTVALTEAGGRVYVTVTGRRQAAATRALGNIASSSGYEFVPNPNNIHAEMLLWDKFHNAPGFRGIGVSHWRGPCGDKCSPFFEGIGFPNIFWTGRYKK
jgi:hypothetical protein